MTLEALSTPKKPSSYFERAFKNSAGGLGNCGKGCACLQELCTIHLFSFPPRWSPVWFLPRRKPTSGDATGEVSREGPRQEGQLCTSVADGREQQLGNRSYQELAG